MDRRRLNRLYGTPANLKLKRMAQCVIGIAIALMILCIFLMGRIPWRLLLIMRGSAGVLTIIFVILVGTLVYRVNCAYFRGEGHDR